MRDDTTNATYRRIADSFRQPLLANQLFSMLPSSNIMGAERKLERSSRSGKKGARQWNHSGQHPGWLATAPAEHGCLSNALQFLIANLELEFELSPKRISNLKFSNRKFMTIFQSENWAASEFRHLPPTNSSEKTIRSPKFLMGTFDISEIESTSGKQKTKQISNGHKARFSRPPWRNNISAFSSLRAAAQIRGSADA